MTLLRYDTRKLKELANKAGGKAGRDLAKHIDRAERDVSFAEDLSAVWDSIERPEKSARTKPQASELPPEKLLAAARTQINDWLAWHSHDPADPTLRADAFAALDGTVKDQADILERIFRSISS